ncbi:hypothetical protein BHM03_00051624 [Ensete ventricosum]|nr:hypothetical protein BHM03_00051624 [Ensete ventricosum]
MTSVIYRVLSLYSVLCFVKKFGIDPAVTVKNHLLQLGLLQDEWVENADRWVAGFLEKFEEGCHQMGTVIKERIQESLQPGGFSLLQYEEE